MYDDRKDASDTMSKDTYDENGFIILESNYSDLFQNRTYLAPIEYCVDRITEYDIHHANTSVMRQYYTILSPDVLDKLDSLGDQRNIEFGNLIRKHPRGKEIAKKLSKGIIRAKGELFRANQIMDQDVLSIKNDAVFVIGRKLKYTKFGHIEFAAKNSYSAYLKLDNLEFYYSKSDDAIAVKGLSDEILNEPDHQNGMVSFLKNVFRFLISDNKVGLRRYLREFSYKYKSLELSYQYYRELNQDNCYRSKYDISGYSFNYTQVNDLYKPELVTTFNYKFYVLPIIQRFYW